MSDRRYHLGIRSAAYSTHSGDGVYVANLLKLESARLHVTTSYQERFASRVRRRAAATVALRATGKLSESLFAASMIGAREFIGAEDALLCHILVPRRRMPIPVLWSSQGLSSDAYYRFVSHGRLDAKIVAAGYRRLASRVERLLIWCETGSARLLEACPELAERTVVIHPPVVVPRRLASKPSLSDGTLRFLFVGMDWRRKGLDTLVEAFEHLLPERCDWQLDVVTGRAVEAPLLVRLGRLGATVHSGMVQHKLTHLMDEADVLVLPSRADTYGLVVVEAMAHGCAVICSRVEPLPEVACSGSAGLAVDRCDFAGAVMSILVDQVAVRRMQAAAVEAVGRRNHPSVVGARIVDCLESLNLANSH